MPAVIIGGLEGVHRELEVVGVLAVDSGLLLEPVQLTVGDADADDGRRIVRMVAHERLQIRKKTAQKIGGVLESGPIAARAVEAELVGVAEFATGDFKGAGVYETHQAEA